MIRALTSFIAIPHWIVMHTWSRSSSLLESNQIEWICVAILLASFIPLLVVLNTHLKAADGPYSVVLPICKACLDSGCQIIVRSARHNAKAKHARL